MAADDPVIAADPLGEALHFLRVTGTFYCRSQLTAPWGLQLPADAGSMWFHVVTSGRCWLAIEGEELRQLQPGDFVLIPHGEGHQLLSDPGTAVERIDELDYEYGGGRYAILRRDRGPGESTDVVCGTVQLDHPMTRRLLELLPSVVLVDRVSGPSGPEAEWMHSTLRLIAAEGRQLRPGGEAVITRLSDILVIQAIRSWLVTQPAAQPSWLTALRDPWIGHALTHIHRDPAHRWTVATLAHEASMSRSAFAARFTSLVGEPVMRYVTHWRMQAAAELLRHEDLDLPIAGVATRLGYSSEAAFNRAFKRTLGTTPATFRATAKAGSRQDARWGA
ncbi:AraC family transcriptional regulator [Kribbella albertanoniae]|uniref:AraC family transcriptional regulator n=1 Tax=Kribbella albertanoniae TaxID=1266829 RepID=A0A4R4Q066_9ACTN|nr:AraC family transcriptional regulator [Kribbella albertanoniae]TDC28123.1 AraC family transcriptional regulator [Kribbella albertanoniae]